MRLSYEFENVLGAVYHRGTIKFGPDASSVFSPVGNKIVVYDLKSNRSTSLPFQVNYNISKICIHPKSTIMLCASEKSHLYLASLTCGKVLHIKDYKSFSQISHISFSPDGKYYCVCGENLILIYITPGSIIAGKGREITPFRLLQKFRVNHDTIRDVAWTADSLYICVASQDTCLSVFKVDDPKSGVIQLKGHSDEILSCYFANRQENDVQLYSLTRNCGLFVWDRQERDESDKEDDSDDVSDSVDNQDDVEKSKRATLKRSKTELRYFRSAKHYLRLPIEPEETNTERNRRSNSYLTASDYNSNVGVLVLGYNTGHYSLFEMPSATLIYDLDSNSGLISSISINRSGDWIAFGSSVDPEADVSEAKNKTSSRLFVWEWQSKSHVLDQYGSGATMSNMHECVSYSLDGTHIVSGNLAGKIKVWHGLTGETIATFGDEHLGPIKAIKFAPNKSGKVIVSASLDGTLRAYDLTKFKNFRTFQSSVPDRSPEFICLDVDSTGEFIAAGTYNYFEIYLFSLQTGKFLEYLAGHEGPVSSVAFSPTSNLLVSGSWDHTVRIWNLFEGSKCLRDTIIFSNEVITVAFRSDGAEFAVSLRNGQIVFFNSHTAAQIGAPIEGGCDLGTTHLVTEASRESKKFFTTLSYSADGSYVLAGGNSNHICIYHAREKMLLKKIAITFNMSFDGVFDYISNRRRKEFGYNLELLEMRQEERTAKPIRLPGVRKGDLGDMQAKPVIAVCQMVFSPTMRSFVAATTEGVLIYSQDVTRHFDPYKLAVDVDPYSVRRAIKRNEFGTALIQTLQLNDKQLLTEVIESIPLEEMRTIVVSLDVDYVLRLLTAIAKTLGNTKHLEYYLLWVKELLYKHGMKLKTMPSKDVTPVMRALHQNVHRHMMDIKINSDYCKYSLEYLTKTFKGSMTTSEDLSGLGSANLDIQNHENLEAEAINEDEMCE